MDRVVTLSIRSTTSQALAILMVKTLNLDGLIPIWQPFPQERWVPVHDTWRLMVIGVVGIGGRSLGLVGSHAVSGFTFCDC